MAKLLSDFRKEIKPGIKSAARAKSVKIIAEMSLAEVRKARGQTQSDLAESLLIAQSNISQIENRPDALISTVRDYAEALGGILEIHVKFPDGQNVEIKQFHKT